MRYRIQKQIRKNGDVWYVPQEGWWYFFWNSFFDFGASLCKKYPTYEEAEIYIQGKMKEQNEKDVTSYVNIKLKNKI